VLAENWRGRSWSLADPPSTTPPTGAVRL
jgi:hypothetical protein